jgi:hypothetical protein
MILIKWVNISLKRAEKSEREKSGHSWKCWKAKFGIEKREDALIKC